MQKNIRALREDKILIYFSPRSVERLKGHGVPGDWIIADPKKVVYPGQTITWTAVGRCTKIEVDLPNVFPAPHQKIVQGDTVSATLDDVAPAGAYVYEVYCNDQLALGGSSPVLIIDP
jgi:plastocyanin